MTEQIIEDKVIQKLRTALGDDFKVQYIGVWQVSTHQNKGEESECVDGVLAVKVQPRSYDTPTIPDGRFDVGITFTIRAELDNSGQKLLDASGKITRVLSTWQKSYDDYHDDFKIDGELEPTGFQMTGGDITLDRENDVWVFSQSFTLYGIVEDVYE